MSFSPEFGAGLWHFANYVDRFATDGYGPSLSTLEQIEQAARVRDLKYVDIPFPFTEGVSIEDIKLKLQHCDLKVIGITPEIYTGSYAKGALTNPCKEKRLEAIQHINDAAVAAEQLNASYVKIWAGQDGWDYPFQVDYRQIWQHATEGMKEIAQKNPDIRFAIEYKPREPRVKLNWNSAARTLLVIEETGCDNIGILLDFGHSLFAGESPADSAQLILDRGRLFGIDVNDNFRGWDDDLVVGSINTIELFEFFYVLHKNEWKGVWQLDQFPFRENHVEAAEMSIDYLKFIHKSINRLNINELEKAQASQDPLLAQKVIREALFSYN